MGGMVGRAKPAEWEHDSDTTPREATPSPRADTVRTPLPADKPRPTVNAAPTVQRPSSRTLEQERHNPTFGIEYWVLGLGASLPSLLCALVLLASAGVLPRVPQLPLGLVLGGV